MSSFIRFPSILTKIYALIHLFILLNNISTQVQADVYSKCQGGYCEVILDRQARMAPLQRQKRGDYIHCWDGGQCHVEDRRTGERCFNSCAKNGICKSNCYRNKREAAEAIGDQMIETLLQKETGNSSF